MQTDPDIHVTFDLHPVLQQMLWQAASMRMDAAYLRFRLALKAGFDPSQPRISAGSAEGGQWTKVGEDAARAGGDFAQVAQNQSDRNYSVDLSEEELRGGHTRRDHVGKADAELVAVLERDWRRIRAGRLEVTYFRPAQGSFLSLEAANDFVNRVLRDSQATVDLVASGKADRAILDRRFGFVTGKEAFRRYAEDAPHIRRTYGVRVVIRHDPSAELGYRVRTAFPTNEKVEAKGCEA